MTTTTQVPEPLLCWIKYTRWSMALLATANIALSLVAYLRYSSSIPVDSIALYLLPQIIISVSIIPFFLYDLHDFSPVCKFVLTISFPALGLFFAGLFLKKLESVPVGTAPSLWIFWMVGGLNVILAIALHLESWFSIYRAVLWSRRRKEKRDRRARGEIVDNDDDGMEDGVELYEPTAVYVYQPQVSLPSSPPPPPPPPPHTVSYPVLQTLTTTNRVTGGTHLNTPARDGQRVIGEEEEEENEALPTYQRKKPRQIATIVDMANMPESAVVESNDPVAVEESETPAYSR